MKPVYLAPVSDTSIYGHRIWVDKFCQRQLWGYLRACSVWKGADKSLGNYCSFEFFEDFTSFVAALAFMFPDVTFAMMDIKAEAKIMSDKGY